MSAAPSVVAIADELLTERQVIDRVPGRHSDVRDWLRGLGIARKGPTGVRVYRWAEVLAAIPLEVEPVVPLPSRATVRRSSRV